MSKAVKKKEENFRDQQKIIHELFEKREFASIQSIIDADPDFYASTTQKGLVSLLTRFAIATQNDDLIQSLIPRMTAKRDYFSVIEYRHHQTKSRNTELFRMIQSELIEPRDIRMMIENELNYLIPLLNHKFIQVDIPPTIDSSPELTHCPLLKIDEYIAKLVEKIKNKRDLDVFIKCIESKHFNLIIDAGNVLHSRDGQIRPEDLMQSVAQTIEMDMRPIVILFHSRAKMIPELDKSITCLSPPNENDDYFILLAYLFNLKRGIPTHILTNDEYQDHVLLMNDGKNVNSDFVGHMRDDQIRYRNVFGKLTITTEVKPYSNCIQIIDRIAYIPTTQGGFIRVHV